MSKPKKMRVSKWGNASWRPYTPERIHPRYFRRSNCHVALKQYWAKKIAAADTESAIRMLQEHSLLMVGSTELDRYAALGWIGRFKAGAERSTRRGSWESEVHIEPNIFYFSAGVSVECKTCAEIKSWLEAWNYDLADVAGRHGGMIYLVHGGSTFFGFPHAASSEGLVRARHVLDHMRTLWGDRGHCTMFVSVTGLREYLELINHIVDHLDDPELQPTLSGRVRFTTLDAYIAKQEARVALLPALTYLKQEPEAMQRPVPSTLWDQDDSETIAALMVPDWEEGQERTNEEWVTLIREAESPGEGAHLILDWIESRMLARRKLSNPSRDEPD